MAGHDKERDRGHDHRSNGSTVQAASAELARQGTEDLRRLSSFLGSTPVAPAILDDASALPQGDGGTGPAFTCRAIAGECDLIVFDASDVFDDAFTVRCPSIDAEGKVSSQRAHLRPLLSHSSSSRFTAGASDDTLPRSTAWTSPVRGSSIRRRSDCGMHPQWQCLGNRIEYRMA